MAAQELAWLLEHQGLNPYEGDIPGAPPPPDKSLHDLAVELTATLRQRQRLGYPIDSDATYFTFQSDQAPSADAEVIPVPKRNLWCLLRRGDTLLVRAGRDAHITSVYDVDRQTQTALIADFWPDRFFLVKGVALFGYSGELVPVSLDFLPAGNNRRILVRVSRDDLLRATVGLITMDTPDLIDGFLSIDPPARNRPEMLLGLGSSLLASDREGMIGEAIVAKGMVRRSIPVLERTAELFQASGQTALEAVAVNKLYLAVAITQYVCIWQGDSQCAKDMKDKLVDIQSRHGGADAILQGNRAVDYVYLGQSAGHANDFPAAIECFTRAIRMDPEYEEAYYDRALTLGLTGHTVEARGDLAVALRLNRSKKDQLVRQIQERPAWDLYGQTWDAAEKERLAHLEALEARAVSSLP